MSFMIRDRCIIDAVAELSAGTNRPPSRKDLMLDMRRRDEAEGERRMMGSGRLCGFWLSARAGLLEMLFSASVVLLDLNCAASFLTCEKS